MRMRIVKTLAPVMLCMLVQIGLAQEPVPERKDARFEISFLKEMNNHHSMAIEMSKLCEGRVIHSDLALQCQIMINDQTAEIQKMQGWLTEWYGIVFEPKMNRKMQKEINMLVPTTGAEFEMMFLKMMIGHHAMAIEESAECLQRGTHEELKKLCAKMIKVQSMEIGMMQGWLCEWYAICPE